MEWGALETTVLLVESRVGAGPVRFVVVVMVAMSSVVAGCLSPQPEETMGEQDDPPGVPEDLLPRRVVFDVISRTGGPIDVAGLVWEVDGARSAVLLIHGSAGGKTVNWAPTTVPGYSLVHQIVASGRTAVSIDLPGYGDTPGEATLQGMEDFAFVVDQVARAIRVGEHGAPMAADPPQTVVGLGHSMGALVVDVTQGVYGSFDGIVPAGWSHGRYSEDARRCASTGECPEDTETWLYVLENMDPRVVDFLANSTEWEPFSTSTLFSMWAWGSCWSCFVDAPVVDDTRPAWLRPDEVSRLIEVPVLSILGDKDFYFMAEDLPDQRDHYPNAASFDLLLLPGTNHMVFHHLNHGVVHDVLITWLDEHDL